MSDKALESKKSGAEATPPHYVITVEEFYSEHYADKIKDGQCIVGLLFGQPKREDYESEAEYKSEVEAFELFVEMNPTGNLEVFDECEKQGNFYLMKSFKDGGGNGSMGLSGDSQLLVFPRTPKLEEHTQ